MKTKLKCFDGKTNTYFCCWKKPKENVNLLCIAEIVPHSVCRTKKSYYPQILIEQCKYKEKERQIVNFIDEEIVSSFDEDEQDSYAEGPQWMTL